MLVGVPAVLQRPLQVLLQPLQGPVQVLLPSGRLPFGPLAGLQLQLSLEERGLEGQDVGLTSVRPGRLQVRPGRTEQPGSPKSPLGFCRVQEEDKPAAGGAQQAL